MGKKQATPCKGFTQASIPIPKGEGDGEGEQYILNNYLKKK
jgi:hypothetical protein